MPRSSVDLSVDLRNFITPLDTVFMGHSQNLVTAPMGIVRQKSALFIELILGIQPYPMASIKFTGTSTSSPQWGQMQRYLGISMELIRS